MIRRELNPDGLAVAERAWWDAWRGRAARAHATLSKRIGDGLEASFQQDVWAEMKEWLFHHVFDGKCAYCEGKVKPQSFGDAEHFRPKGGVTVREGGGEVAIERHGSPHSGYWWLAYEWTNLLPACQYCNSGNGKGTQFPIAGNYAFRPEDAPTLDALDSLEEPLLLHPFRGPDPAQHLLFDDLGQVHARERSRHARHSIAVLDLMRGWLVEDRFSHLQRAETAYLGLLAQVSAGATFSEAAESWIGPAAPYSLAVLQYYQRHRTAFHERLFS